MDNLAPNQIVIMMESFFENATKFKQIRDKYEANHKSIQEIKQQEAQKKKDSKENIYGKIMTYDELITLSENIDSEYNAIPKSEILDWDDRGVPCVFYGYDFNKVFEGTEHHKSKIHTEEKIPEQSSDNPGENCKTQYLNCVEKIKNLQIDIHFVEKNLKGFKNRQVSSCCGGTNVFHFYCAKNNYRFEIVFDDDCDCYPGLLYVSSVENIDTGETHKVGCDLYCNNTNPSVLDNFLNLIESRTIDEFFNKKYAHYFELPGLLTNKGFKVIDNMDKTPVLKINDYDFKFYIEVKDNKGSCLLIPHSDSYKSSDCCLFVCHTLDQINEKDQDKDRSWSYTKKSIDSFVFNHNMMENAYKFNYKDNNQIEELSICIRSFIDHTNGEYGYYDSDLGEFVNDNKIVEYCKRYNKLSLHTYIDNYNGPNFDVLITCNLEDRFNYALMYDHLDMEYISDLYAIRMWYDKKIDAENCYLTIQGKCYNSTDLANAYYHNTENFKLESFIENNVKKISDMVTIKGSYSECFEALQNFIDNIMKINGDEFNNVTALDY
jgi:hypothetical protein